MTKYYADYIWKGGKPYGILPITENVPGMDISYKIISDPYYKRISIEKYQQNNFLEIVYDSALFDFRHLKLAEQLAWQKIVISETETQAISHIRNQDDRLIFIETYRFEGGLCRDCHSTSPHGLPISVQKIHYKFLNDPFNGVMLFDSNHHRVMFKQYELDPHSQEFSKLIEEQWDMGKSLNVPQAC